VTVAIGQQAVVPDFDKSLRQDMQPKAADEFIQGERHFRFAGSVGIVLVGKGDGLLGRVERQQPSIGDADAMGIARQVGQYRLRPGERPLGIDHPTFAASLLHQLLKGVALRQRLQLAVKLQFSFGVKLAQTVAELPAIDFRQGFDRKKPVGRSSLPAWAIEPQTAAGDDAMQVIMVQQGLAPGVQHGCNADLRVQAVAPKLQQRGGNGLEQQGIKPGLVLLDGRIEFMRQREHQMEVRYGQERFGLFVQPGKTVGSLTDGAMAVAAGVRNEMFLPQCWQR